LEEWRKTGNYAKTYPSENKILLTGTVDLIHHKNLLQAPHQRHQQRTTDYSAVYATRLTALPGKLHTLRSGRRPALH
jgi:hypothetical protein